MSDQPLDDLTCLIPLYRSKRFLPIILENIEDHLGLGAGILVSDKHSDDETADLLENRYRENSRVRIFKSKDQGDWVDNINFLMQNTNTRYARIIPHDDTASSTSSSILLNSLKKHPDAVLASGIVKAVDMEDHPLPQKDELNLKEDKHNSTWSFLDTLAFFWTGRFGGAFKGVFDINRVKKKNLYIKKTPTTIHSERLWLTALSIIGRFQFEPDAILKKRYHPSSTHANWKIEPHLFLDSAKVLEEYFGELIPDKSLLAEARFNIYYNALRKTRFIENGRGRLPNFSTISPKNSRYTARGSFLYQDASDFPGTCRRTGCGVDGQNG